jgi:hypothetical protein
MYIAWLPGWLLCTNCLQHRGYGSNMALKISGGGAGMFGNQGLAVVAM